MTDGLVRHVPADNRYELGVGDKTAVVDYRRESDIVTFTHTGISQELPHTFT